MRQRPTQARRASARPQASPEGQGLLDGATLPFTDPIPARALARSIPPRIEGPRAQVEDQVDEAFGGAGLGGTLADALPVGYSGSLTVTHLVECDINLNQGPILRQIRPRPGDDELVTTAGFWDFLSQAGVGDRREVDGDTLIVFVRGCAVWLPDVRTLFWFTLNRDLLHTCQSYFRDRNDILQAMAQAELAGELIRDFSLRLENPEEWFRRVDEQEAAQAVRGRFIQRYGHRPLYPPHFL